MSAAKKRGRFVKSAESDVPVDKSVADIKDLVRKYGAVGFGVSENYESGMSVIELMLPDLPGEPARVPFRIPVNVQRVYDVLYNQPRASGGDPYKESHAEARRQQAERTAWRHAFYTIEVALMTATLGGRPVSESLMADLVVVDNEGHRERMGDYLQRTGGTLAPGVRALLAPPRSEP